MPRAAAGDVTSSSRVLMMCWLCCWPGEDKKDTHKEEKQFVVMYESPRRASKLFSRGGGTSAVSLHLPSTSGSVHIPLCPAAAVSSEESWSAVGRHHSAPSLLHQVLTRRDWGRRDSNDSDYSRDSLSPEPESPPRHTLLTSSYSVNSTPCKKHHSRTKNRRDERDLDEGLRFGDRKKSDLEIAGVAPEVVQASMTRICTELEENSVKSLYRAKDDKQSWNEAVRRGGGREGATHREHCADDDNEERNNLSVEPASYSEASCYLVERGSALPADCAPQPARHASDGDILAHGCRPTSGAFSESEVELESRVLSAREEPPPYCELDLPSETRV